MLDQEIDTLLDKALAFAQSGRLDDAKQIYKQVCAQDDKNEESWMMLGVVHGEQGALDDAVSCLSKAIALDETYLEAYHNLANIRRIKGELEKAKSVLEDALKVAPGDPASLSMLGSLHGMQGNIGEAESYLQEATTQQSDSAEALTNLANVQLSQGKPQEARETCLKALEMQDDMPANWELLARIEQGLGDTAAAIAACDRALSLAPESAGASYLKGNLLFVAGDHAGAAALYRKLTQVQPDYAPAHGALGMALSKLDDKEAARKSLEKSLSLNDRQDWVHLELGQLLLDMREFATAAESFSRVIELAPQRASAHAGLGEALYEQGDYEAAEALLRKAIEMDPELWQAYITLGHVLNQFSRFDEAVEMYMTPARQRRTPGHSAPDGMLDFRTVTRTKLEHDIEQLEYLLDRKLISEDFQSVLRDYRQLLSNLNLPPASTEVVELDEKSQRLLGDTYNRLFNYVSMPTVEGSTLNPELDHDVITEAYFNSGPGILQLDNLLRPEVLEKVRQFCLQSSVWYAHRYYNGYVGAVIEDGFVCPLLLQIAEDLRLGFPNIFKNHRLTKMWAFRYDSRLAGINVHADFAAVNVNFWVTPDEAMLDDDSGGLLMWDKEAPLDWDFDTYNRNQEAIRAGIKEMDAKAVKITHRQNRAAIFNSNLFHETDDLHFREGFENRRVNITLLYGNRQAPRD